MHAQRTVHRDIKGANLLVEKNGRVKLADFGMAKQMADQVREMAETEVSLGGLRGQRF